MPEETQNLLRGAHVPIREMRALAALVRTHDPAGRELLGRLTAGQKRAPLTELARIYLCKATHFAR